jgi:hypothetical protein
MTALARERDSNDWRLRLNGDWSLAELVNDTHRTLRLNLDLDHP